MAEKEQLPDDLLKHIRIDNKTGQRFFITDAGVSIGLKPISLVHSTRWQMEYKKAFPRPTPPVIEVEIGIGNKKEKAYQYYSDDAYYKELVEDYDTTQNLNYIMFLIRYGTTMVVPTDYATMFEADDELARRADYVGSLLITSDDTQYFIQAVTSQNMVTEAAIKEAETRFPSNGAGPERLSIPVLATTGQNHQD